jgi:hypothetical protein
MADNINAVPYMAFGYGQLHTAVRNGVSDSNVTANSGDTIIALTTLTAARTVTLPSASSVAPGKQIVVKDESGSCSGGNTITVVGTVDGSSNYVLNTAYASVRLYSNGSSWNKVGA